VAPDRPAVFIQGLGCRAGFGLQTNALAQHDERSEQDYFQLLVGRDCYIFYFSEFMTTY
jgi:hypothetical protein